MLGRTETRTRDRIYTIRRCGQRDISRDDRARIATCSLRTLTERQTKDRPSIDVNTRCIDLVKTLGLMTVSRRRDYFLV